MTEAQIAALRIDARRLAQAVAETSLADICQLPAPLRERLIRLRTSAEIMSERVAALEIARPQFRIDPTGASPEAMERLHQTIRKIDAGIASRAARPEEP